MALLQKVWRQRLSYRLVRSAEECKIALSSVAETRASLPFISNELATLISQRGLESALSQPLAAQTQHYSQDNLFSTLLGLTGVETKYYQAADDILQTCRRVSK